MKALLLVASLFLAPLSHAQLQVSPVAIRILNGRNAHPVKLAETINTALPLTPYATPIERKADKGGSYSLLLQSDAQLRTVVTHFRTCRAVPKADRKQPPLAYPVEQIVAQGVVAENRCSNHTVAPQPGTLVLFVRPLHWWQRLSY